MPQPNMCAHCAGRRRGVKKKQSDCFTTVLKNGSLSTTKKELRAKAPGGWAFSSSRNDMGEAEVSNRVMGKLTAVKGGELPR